MQIQEVVREIGIPVVIRDLNPGLLVATETGQVVLIKDGTTELLIDLKIRTEKRRRLLLGMDLISSAEETTRIFIYYAEKQRTDKSPPSKEVDSENLHQKWDDRQQYDHLNILEEWELTKTQARFRGCILKIKCPFSNNNGRDNLCFSQEHNLLLLATGDGGGQFDPFNLAQNSNELLGKLLGIDLNETKYLDSETDLLSANVKVLSKGLRNPNFLSTSNGITYLVENGLLLTKIYGFEDLTNNFGWRPIDGIWPTTKKEEIKKKEGKSQISATHVFPWNLSVYPTTGEGRILSAKVGDCVKFESTDSKSHAMIQTDSEWKPISKSDYTAPENRPFRHQIRIREGGSIFLVDPFNSERIRLRIEVDAPDGPEMKSFFNYNALFLEEAFQLLNSYRPMIILPPEKDSDKPPIIRAGRSLPALNDLFLFSGLDQNQLQVVKIDRDHLQKIHTCEQIRIDQENFQIVTIGPRIGKQIFLGLAFGETGRIYKAEVENLFEKI